MNYILRRRFLGATSCKAIVSFAKSPLTLVRNDALPNMENYVFRWGCTSTIPHDDKITVVNQASAIHKTSDKSSSRLLMQSEGISVPKSWNKLGDIDLSTPVIVRPQTHHQGRHLYLCNNKEEFLKAVAACGMSWYGAQYIKKVKEYRVYVVSGRVACVAEKIPADKNAVGWNHALGATFKNIRWGQWPIKGCLEAIKAHELLGLDFSGIDVMETEDGTPYILEGNSAPSLTSEYRQKCFAKCFDYILEHGKAPMKHGQRSYKQLIHPAICEDARGL